MAKISPVNAVILCLSVFFSLQTHGEGTWRERISRHLPWSAAYKLEKLEKQRREEFTQKLSSMNTHELVALGLELKNNSDDNIGTLEEMKALTGKEIRRRMSQDESNEVLQKLSLPREQLEYINSYRNGTSTPAMSLEKFPKWTGDADKFFALFNTLAIRNPADNHKKTLDTLFTDNSEAIKKLPFSTKQIKRMVRYINEDSTAVILLEGALEQAKGDADKFFATFKALTSNFLSYLTDEASEALKNFFEANSEAIKKLPFSTKQVRYIIKYINEVSTAVILLEGALEQAEGDADKFFATYKALTSNFLSYLTDEGKEARRKFFQKKIETTLGLGLSAAQIQYIERSIGDSVISTKILENSLREERENCTANVAKILLED